MNPSVVTYAECQYHTNTGDNIRIYIYIYIVQFQLLDGYSNIMRVLNTWLTSLPP